MRTIERPFFHCLLCANFHNMGHPGSFSCLAAYQTSDSAMNKMSKIPGATIERLAFYVRPLDKLLKTGGLLVSSEKLADLLHDNSLVNVLLIIIIILYCNKPDPACPIKYFNDSL